MRTGIGTAHATYHGWNLKNTKKVRSYGWENPKPGAARAPISDTLAMRLQRVFCSTPEDLEAERALFNEIVGDVNAAVFPGSQTLFVPVTIPPQMTNLAIYDSVLRENVRDCRFFIQMIKSSFGGPERNLRPLFDYAMQLLGDPNAPTQRIAVFMSDPVAAEISIFRDELPKRGLEIDSYSTLDDLRSSLRTLLINWLDLCDAEFQMST